MREEDEEDQALNYLTSGATEENTGFVRSWKTWESHKGFEKVMKICS